MEQRRIHRVPSGPSGREPSEDLRILLLSERPPSDDEARLIWQEGGVGSAGLRSPDCVRIEFSLRQRETRPVRLSLLFAPTQSTCRHSWNSLKRNRPGSTCEN